VIHFAVNEALNLGNLLDQLAAKPNPRWTACNQQPTNSSSKASPTGNARNGNPKAGPSDSAGLTGKTTIGHHQHTASNRNNTNATHWSAREGSRITGREFHPCLHRRTSLA
jgi:hypothetical protein